MNQLEYDFLRKLLRERSGLVLSDDKQYLVESRLLPLARKSGIASLSELIAKMKHGPETLVADVVEAMTTNETSSSATKFRLIISRKQSSRSC